MKPLILRFSGLNSYREVQEIDFTRLCDTGVFGIFGPTGSGKSTILDAITLALYGKVERASNNTQGILNHAEDRLTVSFTFELGNEPYRHRYRVERSYARSGGASARGAQGGGGAGGWASVRTAHCRLIEVSGSMEHVLADKERDVTDRVEEILGLNVQDFTRAVVLPQGRFAEFLSLRGADRRQMLQRLFGLEAYGDKLTDKVKNSLSAVEIDLRAVTAEQQGLGNASDEALDEARRRVEEAWAAEKEAAQGLRETQGEYSTWKQVWDWQNELRQVERNEASLAAKAPEVAAAEAEVDAADRTESIRHLLEESERAGQAVEEAKQDLLKMSDTLDQASGHARRAQEAWNALRVARQEREPTLRVRKASLEQSLLTESDIEALRKKLARADEDILTGEATISSLEASIDSLTQKKNTAQTDNEAARRRLAEITVSPGVRQQISLALSALQMYEIACRAAETARRTLEGKTAALGRAEQFREQADRAVEEERRVLSEAWLSLETLEQAPPAGEQALSNAVQELERVRAEVRDVERCESEAEAARSRLAGLEAELARAADRTERARTGLLMAQENLSKVLAERDSASAVVKALESRNLAAHLAQALVGGEPCPVCGSREHPVPTLGGIDTEIESAREHLESMQTMAKEAEAKVEGARSEKTEAEAALEVKSNLTAEAARLLQEKERALTEARTKLPPEWAGSAATQLPDLFLRREQAVAEIRRALGEWKKTVDGLRATVQDNQDRLAAKEKVLSAADADFVSAGKAADEASLNVQAACSEAEARLADLHRARGEIEVGEIKNRSVQLQAWDTEIESINRAVEKRTVAIQDLVADMNRALESKNQTGLELHGLRAQRLEWLSQAGEKEAQVRAVTGGEPIAQLLSQVNSELERLAAGEEEARKRFDQAASNKTEVEKGHAMAVRTLQMAEGRVQSASTALAGALAKAGFADRAGAMAALRTPDEQGRLRQIIQEFRKEEERLKNDHERITWLLAGRSLSPGEWDGWQERLREAEDANGRALSRRGAAQREHDDLSEKHERWEGLERRREELARKHGLLAELQTVLRGNAFVEYLAEEQLVRIARDASARLGQLTKYRYALEVDSDGGFIMRDDANGGVRRPISTLSGGETFLTSLALALALSAQIQLHGQFPLEFFFLDEGFGTLDPDLLDVVMSTLEHLHLERLNIGVISHVPEMRQRLARRLIVEPAQAGGSGSRVRFEVA